jgi:hypothetical protein
MLYIDFFMVSGAGEASRQRALACFCTICFRDVLFIHYFGTHTYLNGNRILKKILLLRKCCKFSEYRA